MHDQIRGPVGAGLIALGALLLAVWLGATADGDLFQRKLAKRLASLERNSGTGLIDRASATRREAAASGLVGRLEIPRVGLSTYVVEGISGAALRHGVGHVPGTPYPGERGNVGLAGHRDTYLRKLRNVQSGDEVRLTTPDGTFTYRVDSTLIVGSRRGDLLEPRRRVGLTLVTCYPFYYVGPAPSRFVVLARPASDASANLESRATKTRMAPSRRSGSRRRFVIEGSGGEERGADGRAQVSCSRHRPWAAARCSIASPGTEPALRRGGSLRNDEAEEM